MGRHPIAHRFCPHTPPDHAGEHRQSRQQSGQPGTVEPQARGAEISINEEPVKQHVQPARCQHDPKWRPRFVHGVGVILHRHRAHRRNHRRGDQKEETRNSSDDFRILVKKSEERLNPQTAQHDEHTKG
jgi:hypothetical protein